MKKNNQPQRRPMYRDESKFAVYMTRDAHTRFCTTCDKNLFRKVTSSNIRYDSKKQFATKHGYHFMLEVPVAYKDRILSVINSDRQISVGATTNPRKKHEYSSQKHKSTSNNHPRQKLPMGLRPVSGRPAQTATAKPVQKASTPITRPLNLDKTTPTITLEYDIKDLTPQMVEKILGVKWSQLCGKHFLYSFEGPLTEDYYTAIELIRLKVKFDKHPMFQGRKMVFAAYGIAYYNDNKEYIEKPMLYDFSYGAPEPYCDQYGTFISYNPKTKQFEKYPRGWIKLENDILEFGYDLAKTLSNKTEEILSAYSNQKQKTR
ncbi:MAG: hypothetical protein IJD41_01935 [Alphaproteobacteria bacterium]|nr:hypothetical protein [Alphaproteobacteria bacterium]